jgi:hypothetical protein
MAVDSKGTPANESLAPALLYEVVDSKFQVPSGSAVWHQPCLFWASIDQPRQRAFLSPARMDSIDALYKSSTDGNAVSSYLNWMYFVRTSIVVPLQLKHAIKRNQVVNSIHSNVNNTRETAQAFQSSVFQR